MSPVEFLSKVWGHSCQEGDFVFLTTKSISGEWKEHSFKYELGWKRRIKEFLVKYPDTRYNIYFCATPFTKATRQGRYVRHMNLLYSDIDGGEVRVPPSILWQSSPGRLQAVWFLRSSMEPKEGESLNQSLSYYQQADKGGWDLTQVLRLPGTKNLKYPNTPQVHVVDASGQVHISRRIANRIGHDRSKAERDKAKSVNLDISDLSFEQIMSKYKRRLNPQVKRLLCQTSTSGSDRSEMLWYLENKLQEAGMTVPEIFRLIKESVWNKFRGRKDEDFRLKNELTKIVESKIDVPEEAKTSKKVDKEISTGLVVESHSQVMRSQDSNPGWLVKGFWMKQSHGVVAGQPKSFKSTLSMDMAVSVASGEPFLGQHEVVSPGPVLIIQNENAKWIMKDRLMKLTASKGLGGKVQSRGRIISIEWPKALPIHMVNQQGFLLTDPVQQSQLEELIQQIKPVLVILDPLYLMFDGDVNSAKDLSPVLNWLMEIRYTYKTAVQLIHHYSKASNGNEERRGGQRMLGSTTIHGWVESAWYIQVEASNADPDEDIDGVNQPKASASVVLDREFRGAGLHPRLAMELTMGEMGSSDYHVEVELFSKKKDKVKDANAKDLREHVLSEIRHAKNGVSRSRLQNELGLSKKDFDGLIDRMLEQGLIKKDGTKLIMGEERR